GTDGRTKGINLRQSTRQCFSLELAANCHISRTTEEIPGVVNPSVWFSWRVIGVDGSDAKQFARSFAVAAGDDRRMNVVKPTFLEELMNGKGQSAANAKDTTKQIRTRTQMRDFAQKLRSVSFLLQWIAVI